jgi:hypothetical protein
MSQYRACEQKLENFKLGLNALEKRGSLSMNSKCSSCPREHNSPHGHFSERPFVRDKDEKFDRLASNWRRDA